MSTRNYLTAIMICLSMIAQSQTNCGDLIYFTQTGNPVGLGTAGDPVDLNQALQLVTPTRHHIVMLNGVYTYAQKFVIPSETVLDGSYEITGGEWVKNSSLTTTLNIAAPFENPAAGIGHHIAIQLDGVNDVYIKDIILVNTTNAVGTTNGKGHTVYGIHVANSNNFYFSRMDITTGNASNGSDCLLYTSPSPRD